MSSYHGWTHAPKADGGTDPIPFISNATPWMSVYDNQYFGQAISTASSGDNLEFPYIDWSTDAAPYFDYVQSASNIGASNNYNITLKVDGLYLFSWDEHSETDGVQYAVEYHLPINSTPGGTADNRWKQYVMDQNAGWSSTNFRAMGSIMLPCDVGSGITVYPWIQVFRRSAGSDFSMTFRNKLWIAYLGPLNNSATFNSSHHGDPYPTHP